MRSARPACNQLCRKMVAPASRMRAPRESLRWSSGLQFVPHLRPPAVRGSGGEGLARVPWPSGAGRAGAQSSNAEAAPKSPWGVLWRSGDTMIRSRSTARGPAGCRRSPPTAFDGLRRARTRESSRPSAAVERRSWDAGKRVSLEQSSTSLSPGSATTWPRRRTPRAHPRGTTELQLRSIDQSASSPPANPGSRAGQRCARRDMTARRQVRDTA